MQDKVEMLTHIVKCYEEKLTNLSDKCNQLEARNMKAELIIFGIKDDERPCVTIVQDFFKVQLEMETVPDIVYAYWKGKGKGIRPLVVKFQSSSAKGQIFSNLKGRKIT